jgi:signal transduction histidine kinase
MAAFAVTSIPPIIGGALLGVRGGIVSAVFCSVNALVLQLFLGYSLGQALSQTGTATPITLFIALGAGYLNRYALTSKREALERKRAEERAARLSAQLEQAQKMEALGTLAGGVAHDMNNILAVIMSAASVLDRELATNDPRNEHVKDILAASRRGRSLVRNLLGFAHKSKFIKEVFSMNEVIDEIARLLERTINKKILIEKRVQSGGPYYIEADRSQIEQAIMNLCINGVAAMNDMGTLILSLRNTLLTEASLVHTPYLEPNVLKPGRYVDIEVSDTGKGMDSETLEHIFEPFFTTKPSGEGTGLGLSLVYGTVKSVGGAIKVHSQPNAGTTFKLLLPESEELEVRDAEMVRRPLQINQGKVLLVDDENLIRRTGARLLKKLGYDVILAQNGQEAIDIYQREKDHISLIILDLIMPLMDGAEAFIQLKRINPQAKILIASGYEKTKMVETILTHGAAGFIQKPFDIDELSQKLSDTSN